MAKNVTGILAIEWLSACQGMDFRDGLKSSETLEKARKILREKVAYYDKDRYFSPDIDAAINLIAEHQLSMLFTEGSLFSN